MQRDQVIDLLRGAAASGDDWYILDETAEGLFQVTDGSGAAVVAVEQHWAEVRAARNLSHVSQPLPSLTSGSLLRTVVQPGDPPALLLHGRVYLDGFSLHTLYCTVRDVLQLAGPLPAAEEHRPAHVEPATALASEPFEAEAVTELSPVAEEEPPESGVSQAVDETYLPVSSESGATVDEPAWTPEAEGAATPAGVAADQREEEPGPESVPEESAPPPQRMDTPVAATATIAAAAAASPVPPPTPPTMTSSVGSTVQMSRAAMQESLPTDDAPIPAAATSLTCRRCGVQVESGERFCINCGAPQPTGEAGPPPPAAGEAGPPPPAAGAAPPPRSSEPETVAWRRPSADTAPEPAQPAPAATAPSADRCGRCGYENPPGNRFCQGCGSALAAG